MTSTGMIAELIKDTTGPWAEFGRTGKPLTPKKLASLLDEFGIKAKNMRVGGVAGVAKGYERRAFQDTFDRYLSHTPFQSATSEQVSGINGLAEKQSATSGFHVADQNGRKKLKTNDCLNVAHQDLRLGEVVGIEASEDRTCAQCHGAVDGREQICAVGGKTVWLHAECQRFYLDGAMP
jgi:hypothetical protein